MLASKIFLENILYFSFSTSHVCKTTFNFSGKLIFFAKSCANQILKFNFPTKPIFCKKLCKSNMCHRKQALVSRWEPESFIDFVIFPTIRVSLCLNIICCLEILWILSWQNSRASFFWHMFCHFEKLTSLELTKLLAYQQRL